MSSGMLHLIYTRTHAHIQHIHRHAHCMFTTEGTQSATHRNACRSAAEHALDISVEILPMDHASADFYQKIFAQSVLQAVGVWPQTSSSSYEGMCESVKV